MKRRLCYLRTAVLFSTVLSLTACTVKPKGEEIMKLLPVYEANELGTKYYRNPSTIKEIGDPFVLTASDGYYYLFATSASDGYYCWKSKDLIHWTEKTKAFTADSDSWCTDSFWAPEVVEWENSYYMFFTARGKEGRLHLGLAVSDSPAGPYEDVLKQPLFDPGYAMIDANVLIDGENKYLYFSRDCSENVVDGKRKSEIYGVQLANDLRSVISEPVLLLTPDQPWEFASSDPLWNEAPEMIKHDGSYYLTYSANCYASSSYSIGYAVSKEPLGSFVKAKENPIVTAGSYPTISGSGHHSFAWSPDKTELFLIYHTHTYPSQGGGNRQVNLDRAIFLPDGRLHVNGPTQSRHPFPNASKQRHIEKEAVFTFKEAIVTQLNDGVFSIHKKDQEFDFEFTTDEQGKAVITAQFSEPVAISGCTVYQGSRADQKFESVAIQLEGQLSNPVSLSEKPLERGVTIIIEPVTTQTIKFHFQSAEPQKTIAVSEITIVTLQ